MKKLKLIILVPALFILLSGCLIKSVHPFYFEKDVVFKEQLLGIWMDQDSTKWKFSQYKYSTGFLKPDKTDNSYQVVFYDSDNDSSIFNAHLFEFKGQYYFDFYPVTTDLFENELYSYHLVNVHSLAKVFINDSNTLEVKWYNENWLKWLVKNKWVRLDMEKLQHGEKEATEDNASYILTSPTKKLQKFISKYGDHPYAFKENFEESDDEDEIFVHKLQKSNE